MPADAVLLDANLLVLLIVGSASISYIPKHKRTRAYTANDFALLVNRLAQAASIVVTPNTITEASNLAGRIDGPARSHIFAVFRALLLRLTEVHVVSSAAAEDPIFLRLGLTDSVLLQEAFKGHVLLTADLDLYLEAARRGRNAINFNHYIEANQPGR